MTRRHRARGVRRGIEKHALDNEDFKKIWRINEALRSHDLAWLRRLGREPAGFINDAMRRRVWYMVANIITIYH